MSTPHPATNLDHDSLAQALAWLTRHHGRERSVASLLAELMVDGRLQPEQALRALRDAGYEAGLLQRELGEIHALLMPAVGVGPLVSVFAAFSPVLGAQERTKNKKNVEI